MINKIIWQYKAKDGDDDSAKILQLGTLRFVDDGENSRIFIGMNVGGELKEVEIQLDAPKDLSTTET